jgi:phosphodiesterase/alkaline phosphatase D-like protein
MVLSDTSVRITWNSSDLARSTVEYGLIPSYGQTTTEPLLNTNAVVNLIGLNPGTLYHYRVKSTNLAGLVGQSGDFTFLTSGIPIELTDFWIE